MGKQLDFEIYFWLHEQIKREKYPSTWIFNKIEGENTIKEFASILIILAFVGLIFFIAVILCASLKISPIAQFSVKKNCRVSLKAL